MPTEKQIQDVLEKFYTHRIALGVKDRVAKYDCVFVNSLLRHFPDKDIQKISKDDLENYLAEISKLKPLTQHAYRSRIRYFFRWFFKNDDCKLVSWIKPIRTDSVKTPEELLKVDEIKALVNACDNARDKAMLMLTIETACIPHEITNLRIKNIEYDKYGVKILVDGKTGQRSIRIINSVPDLMEWLRQHPYRNDHNAWVFGNAKKQYKDKLGQHGFNKMLKKIMKKAGLNKNVYPYLLRHTRLTQVPDFLQESDIKVFAGWSADSKMARRYIHRNSDDVDKKILQAHGIIKPKKTEDELKPKICPRCNLENSSMAKFCNFCSLPLNQETIKQFQDKVNAMDDAMNELSDKDIDRIIDRLEDRGLVVKK